MEASPWLHRQKPVREVREKGNMYVWYFVTIYQTYYLLLDLLLPRPFYLHPTFPCQLRGRLRRHSPPASPSQRAAPPHQLLLPALPPSSELTLGPLHASMPLLHPWEEVCNGDRCQRGCVGGHLPEPIGQMKRPTTVSPMP